MIALTITSICQLLENQGEERLERSPVCLRQHALQTAWLAERSKAAPSLVCASLLHDLGYVLPRPDVAASAPALDEGHDIHGAGRLSELFDVSVTDPIRLHVRAKRYLCYAHPGYPHGLSAGARRALERQGGAFTAAEARAFMQEPYAVDAVNLRLWDDQAHESVMQTPPLAHYAAMLRTCVLPKRAMANAASEL